MPERPKQEEITETEPITETETSVSYLGVKLEKAENKDGRFVPRREQFSDFINDKEISLPLQRDVAVAFLSGEPFLIEGGTSLGKTTTVRKMAAELGWEVHYANLNGATDVEDLMGKYIPNPNKNKPEDTEYIFADGKVTSGLRQEEGKVKIIILDEFNAAAPNILIRLHEVLDVLERGGDVVLSEDASETLSASKAKTKVVALTNPPGKGYFGREPLDPAQLRRWVYKKLPGELPKETFSYVTNNLFGREANLQTASAEMFLKSQERVLSLEQLQEIPGIWEVLEKFKEFHIGAKELLKNRKIAEDQPQPFTYDDRMEPRRVRDFVLRFYNGDVNETFQQALRYYYANKLETEADRKKMEELIRMVECKLEPSESKRKGLERGEKAGSKKAESPERSQKTELGKAREKASKALDSLLSNPNVPDAIKESLRANESESKMESFFQEQYEAQLATMQRVGMVETLESGELGIKGIDGKEYPIPTQDEIAEKLEANKELVERKREQGFTRLLLVPFGSRLDSLAETYKQSILNHRQEGKLFTAKKNPDDANEQLVQLDLDENQPLWKWDGYNDADINGKLVYQPKEFSANHDGKTKQEILNESGGWQALLIEDMPNIPREGSAKEKGGRTQIDTIGSSIKKHIKRGENIPSPAEYLKALDKESVYDGESGMTPEDHLTYAILHLEETDQVIDDYKGNGNVSYQIGAYFPSAGYVPYAYWGRGYRQADLSGSNPDYRDDYCGVRPAVRI